MTIHKEGKTTLLLSFLILTIFNVLVYYILPKFTTIFLVLSFIKFVFLVSFFRKPTRDVENPSDSVLFSPADGKIVVIEKVFEEEYLKKECLLVSVFMSPLNVHINWYPITGVVTYFKYHPGKFFAAWNPKSSTENERTTIGLQTTNGEIVIRQIAGALARRIVCYSSEHHKVKQGSELGFIKFGSRVDIYLPLETKMQVKLGDVVNGNITQIATF